MTSKFRFILALAILTGALLLTLGCSERRLSDAEMGLNPQQARGRRVWDAQCARCHEPHSASARKGPVLKNVYQKPYLPSGLPANDERMTEVILRGRNMMPGFSESLTQQQLDDLLAFMRKL